MIYTLPSRYCQSDLLSRMARGEFGELPPGGATVRGIADWVRTHVEYRYGTTDAMTSAFDTATERMGVCRDFAHLVIAFCRALGIPARYISGYALGLEPPDFHGFAQVYLGGTWHNVDATPSDSAPPWCPSPWAATPPTSLCSPPGVSAPSSSRPWKSRKCPPDTGSRFASLPIFPNLGEDPANAPRRSDLSQAHCMRAIRSGRGYRRLR